MKTLQLISPDALICLNGSLPHFTNLSILRSQKEHIIPLIAADGTAIQLQTIGFMPEYIIGDLDSIAQERTYWDTQPTKIIHIADQNSTDFEKSLDFAQSNNWNSVLVCGLHGGDLDHTMNNLSIVMRYGRAMNICVYEEGRVAIPLYESIAITTEINTMISLIPQPSVRLTTNGLQWELHDEVLELAIREGARNRARNANITLKIHEGALFMMLHITTPKMLVVT